MCLATGFILFTGCASSQQNVQVKQEIKKCNAYTGAPAWVIDPTVDDGVGVLGISGANSGGASFQEDIARADAYHKAGNEIKTITLATLDLLRESGKVDNSSKTRESMKNVTALEVNSIEVSGLKRKKVWISDCTGDMFTHYVIADTTIKNNIKDTLEKANASNEIIDEAMSRLDKDITKIKENAKNR